MLDTTDLLEYVWGNKWEVQSSADMNKVRYLTYEAE